jgi:hypothetical protein
MAEHPEIFIQHLPAGARASLCRMMAAAAGFIGNCIGKAVVLWHLGQAQMEVRLMRERGWLGIMRVFVHVEAIGYQMLPRILTISGLSSWSRRGR